MPPGFRHLHAGCVFDFGAGHSVYEDPALFARARAALAPFANVVLLLPSPDPDESVLRRRQRDGECADGGLDFHEHFVRHPSNRALASASPTPASSGASSRPGRRTRRWVGRR
jgi:hypothetical protein